MKILHSREQKKKLIGGNIEFGLSKTDIYYNNGTVKYGSKQKLWKFTLRNYQKGKFNRTQPMRRVDSQRGKKTIQTEELIHKRGMRIEKINYGDNLQMEADYGRLKTYQTYDGNI